MFRRAELVPVDPPGVETDVPEQVWPMSEYAMSAVSHLWLAHTTFSACAHASERSSRGRHEPAAVDPIPPQARRSRRRGRRQLAS